MNATDCNTRRTSWFATRIASISCACVIGVVLPGCTSLLSPINAIPANRLPPQFLAQPRANYAELELHRLGQESPEAYRLDTDDVLGIYIEGVLPPKGAEDVATAPPVHFPEAGSDLPPSVGFPIPVRDDGTLALPLIDPIDVRGMTLTEVEREVRDSYTIKKKILQEGRDRIIVTLMEERTVRVIVIREDRSDELAIAGGQQSPGQRELVSGTDRSGSGYVLDLPAYKNDLMHALAETGGLPGLNAKNKVKILRRRLSDERRTGAFVESFYAQYECDKCMNPPPLPDDPSTISIPLRFPPGQVPNFTDDDVILEDGDIIYIEARDTEVFYTGGLLPGGQFPLPRDYDIDVLGAMAVAGQGVGGAGRTGGGGGAGAAILGGGFGGASPSQLYVFRTLDDGRSVTIAVDLVAAMNDPSQRLLVKPGDTLVLRYKPCEEIVNFSLIGFFTFGVRTLFN